MPPMPDPITDRDAEDAKLVTLARSARARTGAAQGAAVRDDTGRTYVATTVALPSLALTALQAAVAAAVSSGAGSLEAAAVVGPPSTPEEARADLTVVRDLAGPGVLVHHAAPDGSPGATDRT